MGGVSLWQILILIVIFAVGVLPWVIALISKKAKGGQKFLWFLLSFFFSWLGYVIYYFVVVRHIEYTEENFVPHEDNPNRQAPY